jgi:hypothetical protein
MEKITAEDFLTMNDKEFFQKLEENYERHIDEETGTVTWVLKKE